MTRKLVCEGTECYARLRTGLMVRVTFPTRLCGHPFTIYVSDLFWIHTYSGSYLIGTPCDRDVMVDWPLKDGSVNLLV